MVEQLALNETVPGSSPGGRTNKNPVWGFLFVRGSEVKRNFRRKEKIEVERRRMRPTGVFDADPGRNEGGAFWRRQSEVITPFGVFYLCAGGKSSQERGYKKTSDIL